MTHESPVIARVQLATLAYELHTGMGTGNTHACRMARILADTGDLPEWCVDTAFYEEGSREHGVVDLFHAGGVTRIHLDGTVNHFAN